MVKAFDLKAKKGENLRLFADVHLDSWYSEYVKISLDHGLLEQNPVLDFFGPEENLTRGEAFLILYKILAA